MGDVGFCGIWKLLQMYVVLNRFLEEGVFWASWIDLRLVYVMETDVKLVLQSVWDRTWR